ncbi:MAG: hypothetical protein II627_00670 [Lachnospiraceae bacterium]|nr:hypothetical protein [Lachnospiraceae bacterium]
MEEKNNYNEQEQPTEKSLSVWGKVLSTSVNLPFVKVNREEFLTKELSKFCTPMEVMTAIEDSPLGVLSKKEIDKLANQCISYHLTMVCGTSALMGLPGGWWMAGTIPADITQFYGHILSLMQKLIYLYGWPALTNVNNQLDDESLNIMTLFVGVMMGNKVAIEALTKVVTQMSKNAGTKISETVIAHYAVKIAQWIGINMTKEGFAKGVGKVIPLVGAPISATITYYTFRPMARRLKKHLDELYEMGKEHGKVRGLRMIAAHSSLTFSTVRKFWTLLPRSHAMC